MKQRSYSLQRINSFRSNSIMKAENRPRPRLNFPLQGDPNLYAGFGKKHYYQKQQPDTANYQLPRMNSENNIFKRNTLDVRDIYGAYPSVMPMSEVNKLKALQGANKQSDLSNLRKKTEIDSLMKLEQQFDLKKNLNPENHRKFNTEIAEAAQVTPVRHKKIEALNPISPDYHSQIYNNNSLSIRTHAQQKQQQPRKYNPTYISDLHMF